MAELDEAEVAEIEGRIALVEACRNYAGELALNQIAPRVHSEMKDFFDTSTTPLLDGLRVPDLRERKYRKSQVDAAVRFPPNCSAATTRRYWRRPPAWLPTMPTMPRLPRPNSPPS